MTTRYLARIHPTDADLPPVFARWCIYDTQDGVILDHVYHWQDAAEKAAHKMNTDLEAKNRTPRQTDLFS